MEFKGRRENNQKNSHKKKAKQQKGGMQDIIFTLIRLKEHHGKAWSLDNTEERRKPHGSHVEELSRN